MIKLNPNPTNPNTRYRCEQRWAEVRHPLRPNVRLGNMWLFGRNIRRYLRLRTCSVLCSPL